MPKPRRCTHEAQYPGPARRRQNGDEIWKVSSWSASIEPSIAGIRRSRSTSCAWAFSSPRSTPGQSISGRLYCTPKALWKLNWFLRDFGYDPDLMGRDEVDERALLGLRGVVRTSRTVLNGRCFLNLERIRSSRGLGRTRPRLRRHAATGGRP